MKKWIKKSLIILGVLIFLGVLGSGYCFYDKYNKEKEKNEELSNNLDSTNKELKNLNLKFKALSCELTSHDLYLRILEERDKEIRNDLLFFTDMELYEFQNELDSLDEIFKIKSIPNIEKNLDNLGKRIKIQSNKYDSLHDMVRENISYLLSIPLIKPIHSKDIFTFSSEYGMRIDPFDSLLRFHEGLDIVTEFRTPVLATGWGHVQEIIRSKYGYGKRILINHGYGYKSFYAHLNVIYVKEGDIVKRGQIIGRTGCSGRSTGVHLHYEVYKNNKHVDPINHFYSYETKKTKKFKKLILLK